MTKHGQVRRPNDAEGRQLQQIVRRGGKTDRSIVQWRRAMVDANTAEPLQLPPTRPIDAIGFDFERVHRVEANSAASDEASGA